MEGPTVKGGFRTTTNGREGAACKGRVAQRSSIQAATTLDCLIRLSRDNRPTRYPALLVLDRFKGCTFRDPVAQLWSYQFDAEPKLQYHAPPSRLQS
ncbi:hypothetical protein J6590_018770 [Homalodisca vitripennis]|nr:hypothetical protein J6590_018770 [Homalodisca vitripennis]